MIGRRTRTLGIASLLAVTTALILSHESVQPAAALPAAPPPTAVPATAQTAPGAARAAAGAPTRLRIPAITVDTPLDPLGLDAAGALDTPADYAHAGWYSGGTSPGDVGPAVIAGHVDSIKGPAVFYRLYQLRPADLVEVERDGGWVRFEVQTITRYAKDRFPTAQVYGPTPDPQLRLITCGGIFNRSQRSYVDNIVVSAVLADR